MRLMNCSHVQHACSHACAVALAVLTASSSVASGAASAMNFARSPNVAGDDQWRASVSGLPRTSTLLFTVEKGF